MKHLLTALFAALALLVGPAFLMPLLPVATAQALTIDFSTGGAGAGGTIALLGGGHASGTNILIGNMLVTGNTGGFNGNFTVTSVADPTMGTGLLDFNTSTGAISITGSVTIGGTLVTGTLLSDTIAGHTLIGPGCPAACTGPLLNVQADGTDKKLQALLTALGGDAATIGDDFDFLGSTITADFDPAAQQGTAISTDFANNSRPPPPPPGPPPSHSEEPGSVLVFPKFIRYETEIEISAVCPTGERCASGLGVLLKAHWVCPGATDEACNETDFRLRTTVNGTCTFTAAGGFGEGCGSGAIPAPPCERGYLIVWVVDDSDKPIKFDGLIGDAVLQEETRAAYNAIPVQAVSSLSTGDLTDVNGDLALDFDGVDEYKLVTGQVMAPVRYENSDVQTFLTLLTLDVNSRRINPATNVDFIFCNESEECISASTNFVCWMEKRLTEINVNLTESSRGSAKGLMKSVRARQGATNVTLLGIIETRIGSDLYSYSLYNDSIGIPTKFIPND